MPNPFDNPEGRFRVVVNDEGQHALWLPSVEVPAGWTVVYGEADRAACLEYITKHWTDMRPVSLVRQLEQARTAEQDRR